MVMLWSYEKLNFGYSRLGNLVVNYIPKRSNSKLAMQWTRGIQALNFPHIDCELN